MQCIMYEKRSGVIAGHLKELLKMSAVENSIEHYHSIKKLSGRLKRPVADRAVMVLIAADHTDLFDLFTIRELYATIRVIVILPDREDESVKLGHKLRPRFLTYVNGAVSEVHAVLKKMLELSEPNEPACAPAPDTMDLN